MRKFCLLVITLTTLLSSCYEGGEFESINKLQRTFDKSQFANIIEGDFEVDWQGLDQHFSEELGASYLECPIKLKGQNTIPKGKYNVSFSLLVIKDDQEVNNFYVSKFFNEIRRNSTPSFSDLGSFTGLIHLLDNENELFFAKKVENGVVLDNYSFADVGTSSPNARMMEDCYTVTTYHYIDWYVNGSYVDSYLEDVTHETECYSSYLPDLYLGGGGGGGSYGSETGGGAYDDCGDPVHGCIYELKDIKLNGELFEDQIDDSNLKPCMQPIVSDLKTITKGVGHIVTKFAGNTQGWNWKLQDGTLPGGVNANTSQQYNSSTGTVTTTFDVGKFTSATNLSIARTILHESVHAFLVVYFRTDPLAASKTYTQLLQDYYQTKDANAAHHIEMTRSFVNDIALALQEYGTSRGYNLSSQFYQDLAWGGLTGTPAFQALSTTDQNRINNTILTEQTGKNSQGNTQQQKGTNAGC